MTVTTGNMITQGTALAGRYASTAGGVAIEAMSGTVSRTDTTAKALFDLPPGAVPLDVLINVTTAFNDSGTDVLDVGKTGTDNYFVSALDVSATGRKAPTRTNLDVSVGSSKITVTAKYTGQNGNSTTGAAVVTVLYVVL
jgi:hypothetical protein